MKVALYCRVSTEEQAQGFSIHHQKERMVSYCHSQGWSEYELYIDDGYTGTNMNRPHLKYMLHEIQVGHVQMVLVYKLDRLSRRQKDVLHLLEDVFEPYQVGFRSVTEPFDTSTPFGKAMIGMLAVFAQLERDTIIERTRSGKRERTKQGRWYGGPVPYGYEWSLEKQKLLPNGAQAPLVREMFHQFVAGKSYMSLARWLSERSKERLFSSHKTLLYMLTNPIYVGKLNYLGQLVPGLHDPLIDEETWQRAQEEVRHRRLQRSPYGKYLLSNLMVCGSCGAPLKHTHRTDRRAATVRNRDYYLCSAKHQGKKCASRYYPAQLLEEQVVTSIKGLTLDTDLVKGELNKVWVSRGQDETLSNQLKANLLILENRLARWYHAFEVGQLDAAQVANRLEELEAEKQAVRLRLHELETEQPFLPSHTISLLHSLSDVSGQWSWFTAEEKSIVLHAAVRRITVHPDGTLEFAWNQ